MERSSPLAPSASPAHAAVRTVLVVDDVQEICHFFTDLIKRVKGIPLKLTTETNSQRALALLATQPFDIVVSDFRMPGVDGIAILMMARAMNPGGHRVLVTGYNEIPAPLWRIRRAEVDAYLQKPIQMQELILLFRDLLNGNDGAIATLRAHARELERVASLEEDGRVSPD